VSRPVGAIKAEAPPEDCTAEAAYSQSKPSSPCGRLTGDEAEPVPALTERDGPAEAREEEAEAEADDVLAAADPLAEAETEVELPSAPAMESWGEWIDANSPLPSLHLEVITLSENPSIRRTGRYKVHPVLLPLTQCVGGGVSVRSR